MVGGHACLYPIRWRSAGNGLLPDQRLSGPPRERPALWILVVSTAVLVGVSLATTALFVELLVSVHQTAFAVFYQAAANMAGGHSPYRVLTGIRLDEAFEYLPWVALALVPFTHLNFSVAFHLWLALNGALAVGSAWGMAKALGWRRPWLLAGSVVLWEVLWRGLLTGQVDGLLLAFESASIISAARGRYGLAGSSSVIAALLKPHLMWILPVALMWPAWKHCHDPREVSQAQ
jgi:hypothetical protein